ncbi:hypothetical protein KEM48_010545 [Puccinia striiformis f. sp. tritici PST-130]|nr:hypothetical protein KEM48_010545 [Puccinia striiformis f. sp. tritici PST-130]
MARARPTRIKPQVNPADSIDDSLPEYEGSDEISDGESFEEESEAGSCDDDMECSNVELSHRFDQPMKNLAPSKILAHQKMMITNLLDAIIPKSGINLILNPALTPTLSITAPR